MRLYVVQTGEALYKGQDPDFDRPLSDKGRLSIERLASMLSRVKLQSKKVIHSGNVRARQTLEILEWATAAERELIEARSGLSPDDPVEPWVEEITSWKEDAIIVGHQPFVGKLVSRLLKGQEAPPMVLFVPGTAVCLERTDGGWGVVWVLSPELIAASRY